MKLIKILAFLYLIVNAIPAIAQVSDGFTALHQTEEVRKLITENATNTKSLSSDFTQEKHLTMMEEVLVSKGSFLYKKENNVCWEYIAPINYRILIRNEKFTIDNDGKISSFDTESNKLFKEINNMILMAIQGNFVDDPNFSATFLENNAQYLARLKPQDEILKNILETIEIFFNKDDASVTMVKFIEPEEDFTLIKFTNRKQNITITDDQFQIQSE